MKIIDMNTPRGPDRLTVMIGGHSRAGKTRVAATFPRPIILGEASEQGWTTARYMNDDQFYEPGRRPFAIGIEQPADMFQCLQALQQQASGAKPTLAGWPAPQGKHEIQTVVIDSLTFYADSMFSQLEIEQARNDKKSDKRQLYGELQSHLRHLMIQFHRLPFNIIWTALASLNEDSALRGALIAGQTAAKAPARCDLWVYVEQVEERVDGRPETVFRLHTQNHNGYKAGHRFGDRLRQSYDDPNYRQLEAALNLMPMHERIGEPAPERPAQDTAAAKPSQNHSAGAQPRRRARPTRSKTAQPR